MYNGNLACPSNAWLLHGTHFLASALAISETTATVVTTFVLAMLKNPNVQYHAQQEVDSVIGDRLPEFSDIPHLPYLSAVIKEVLRYGTLINPEWLVGLLF